ncbi:MAG: DUF3303 family protein [Balneolaceae bacterium]|jgi:hypothetical protein
MKRKREIMLFMTRWSIKEDNYEAAVQRFSENPPEIPKGVTQVGRWHELGTGDGFALFETDDPTALSKYILSWADIVDQHMHAVVDDEAIAKALSQM